MWNEKFAEQFINCEQIFMDATYSRFPLIAPKKNLRTHSLLTIHVLYENNAFPIAWVFMHGRTEAVYRSIFKEVFKKFENYDKIVMCDFEQAMRNAVKDVLPKAVLKGCYFHHVQAIQKTTKDSGLWKQIKDDSVARDHLRLLMAVATLPANKMREGFELVECSLPQKYAKKFEKIFDYYDKNWLIKRDPEEVSVWKLRQNTNNYCESYHAWLASHLQRRPKPWKLIVLLLEKMAESERKLKSIETGIDPSRRNKKNLFSKSLMSEAAEKFEQEAISMKFYLKQMSMELQKRKNNFEAPSDDESSTESESSDQENEDENPTIKRKSSEKIKSGIPKTIKILSDEVIAKTVKPNAEDGLDVAIQDKIKKFKMISIPRNKLIICKQDKQKLT
ncbi:uncharacterized protein LOC123261503 [Cotesia glomerata]|uniref:uncharacterized protein LOC123261503 n=1 Tax=Cotesia glomerata TaxID=32391 RepID=UPI001D0359D4|nr:uncharacterized protein LOC123261503 [Cotesia glomerata]